MLVIWLPLHCGGLACQKSPVAALILADDLILFGYYVFVYRLKSLILFISIFFPCVGSKRIDRAKNSYRNIKLEGARANK